MRERNDFQQNKTLEQLWYEGVREAVGGSDINEEIMWRDWTRKIVQVGLVSIDYKKK